MDRVLVAPVNDRPIDRNITISWHTIVSRKRWHRLSPQFRGAVITRGRHPGRSFSNVKTGEREKERERARACLVFWTGHMLIAPSSLTFEINAKRCSRISPRIPARIVFRCEPMTRREKHCGLARKNAPFVDCEFHGGNTRLYTTWFANTCHNVDGFNNSFVSFTTHVRATLSFQLFLAFISNKLSLGLRIVVIFIYIYYSIKKMKRLYSVSYFSVA